MSYRYIYSVFKGLGYVFIFVLFDSLVCKILTSCVGKLYNFRISIKTKTQHKN